MLLLCAAIALYLLLFAVTAQAEEFPVFESPDTEWEGEIIYPHYPVPAVFNAQLNVMRDIRREVISISNERVFMNLLYQRLRTLEETTSEIAGNLQDTQAAISHILAVILLFFIIWLVVISLKGIYAHMVQVWF
jgi:hypothetical protein